MSYSSTTTPAIGNIVRCVALLTFISGFGMASSVAEETPPPPPEKATPAEVTDCEREWMERSGAVDLGGTQYRDKIRDLCNTSVHGAPEETSGEAPATNDYFVSGGTSGFVYELGDECQQVRLASELIYICPEGRFKPTIRNNQSGFMPYEAPETP